MKTPRPPVYQTAVRYIHLAIALRDIDKKLEVNEIKDHLATLGFIVTVRTIQRDCLALEVAGLVVRSHGKGSNSWAWSINPESALAKK